MRGEGAQRGPRGIAIVLFKKDSEYTDGRKTPTQGCMKHFNRRLVDLRVLLKVLRPYLRFARGIVYFLGV